jgi:thioredoxin reductase (NADPH)
MDGVFIFIGFEPNNQVVPAGIKKNADGYVMTDENCKTAIDGIYAIGDLREKTFRQIVISAADGSVAALASAHYVELRQASPEACELPAHLLA